MEEFRSVPEEVRNLLRDIEETKEALRAISSRISAIDKHVRRVFQIARPPRTAQSRVKSKSSLTRDELLQRFDSLRKRVEAPNSGPDDSLFDDLGENDLRALAYELGIANAAKLGVPKLRASVLQKVRESVMLGTSSLRGIEQSGRQTQSNDVGLPKTEST